MPLPDCTQFLSTKSGLKTLSTAEPHLWGITPRVQRFLQRLHWLLNAPESLHPVFLGNASGSIPEGLPTLKSLASSASQWMASHLLGIRSGGWPFTLDTAPCLGPVIIFVYHTLIEWLFQLNRSRDGPNISSHIHDDHTIIGSYLLQGLVRDLRREGLKGFPGVLSRQLCWVYHEPLRGV